MPMLFIIHGNVHVTVVGLVGYLVLVVSQHVKTKTAWDKCIEWFNGGIVTPPYKAAPNTPL